MRKPTKINFTLRQLVEIYIETLSGTAYSRRYKEDLPVYVVYQDVMEILDGTNQTSKFGRDLAKQYKEKIIGKTALTHAPEEYHHLGIMEAHNIRLHEWKAYDIHDKARIIAVHYLKNMLAVVDDYYRSEDDTKRKQEEEAERKSKRKKGKSKNDSAEE